MTARRSQRGHVEVDIVMKYLEVGRNAAIKVRREAKIGSERYRAAGLVADAIDELAEELVGDRTVFHTKNSSVAASIKQSDH